ncbi:hypothetical protein B0H19DRAFT_1385492 [Mycena capillaripes]|nr:hypothetical protein B0H19DRAFT_1385492 [Mycena capillaripes]
MHSPFKYFAILTVVAQLSQLSFATWQAGKAAQINFYRGGACHQYAGEATAWWTSSPLIGGNGEVTEAQCITLGMPGDSTGINIAMMWEKSTASDTVEPASANGLCIFWDGFNCSENELPSGYVPAGDVGAPCQPGRSEEDSLLWKSAKCFIDATESTSTPPPTSPPPPSSTSASTSTTPTTTPTSSSTTSLSTSINHTSPPSPYITSHSTSSTPSSISSSTIFASSSPPASSPSTSSSISATLASASTPQQSAIRAARNSLSTATIAGIIAGVSALIVVAMLLAFCVWRRGRKKPETILPYQLVSEQNGQEAQRGAPMLSALSEKPGMEQDSQHRSPTPDQRRLQQSLVASELRALREEMARISSAMTSGDGSDARIRALERGLQSYADAERLDPSLPRYMD